MGKYVTTATQSFEFDGDHVVATFNRITYADALSLQEMTPDAATQLIRKYVLDITGVRDASNAPVSVTTIFDQFYFAPLVAELTKAVLATGSVPEGGASNFGVK